MQMKPSYCKVRPGVGNVEEEVIKAKKIFVGPNVSTPFSRLLNFQNFSYLKSIF